MRIIADQNLANIEELLAGRAELTLLPGREINSASVRGHDALLVRSITRVDESLLAKSGIRFVGTATSGLDHIDTEYLAAHDIALAHAAGSNAEAVVDYCLSAMAHLGYLESSKAASVGILGFGQVGSRLHQRLRAMGISTKLCDPLVASALTQHGQAELASAFVDKSLLSECDVVSLHVPLSLTGSYPTGNLVDQEFLESMRRDSLLIQTCRGGVLDESALLCLQKQCRAPRCAIDVWLDEPSVNPELVASANLATPHIAGYSARAKFKASQMVVSQLSEFMAEEFCAESARPDYVGALAVKAGEYLGELAETKSAASAIRSAFDLSGLDQSFKQAVMSAENGQLSAKVFDGFRNALRERSEFSELKPEVAKTAQGFMDAAGFSSAR